MLVVIPDRNRNMLMVEIVPPEYATRRPDEINAIIVSYFAMLNYSLKTMNKPNIFEPAVINTVEKARFIMSKRSSEHIEKVQSNNAYTIRKLAENLECQKDFI